MLYWILPQWRKLNFYCCSQGKIIKHLHLQYSLCAYIGARVELEFDATAGVSPLSPLRNNEAGSSTKPDVKNSGYLPRQADHLIAFATGDGYPASRVTNNGSWYIDELTKVMHEEYSSRKSKKRNPRHLLDVLTEVHGRVSNLVSGQLNEVQMPEFRSFLRGPIYLWIAEHFCIVISRNFMNFAIFIFLYTRGFPDGNFNDGIQCMGVHVGHCRYLIFDLSIKNNSK